MNHKYLHSFFNVPELCASALVFLFAYAACSKLLAFEQFSNQMHLQPFSPGFDSFLVVVVPFSELSAVALLLFRFTRTAGFWLACLLMMTFSGYVTLVLLHFWKQAPCSCGGILRQLSWRGHLVFNLIFFLITIAGLFFNYKERRLGDHKV